MRPLSVVLVLLAVVFLAAGVYATVRGRFTEVERAVGSAGIAKGDDVVTHSDDDGLVAVTTARDVPGARVRAVVSRHASGLWAGMAREQSPAVAVAATEANVDAAGVGSEVTVEASDLTALEMADSSASAVLCYRLGTSLGGGKRRHAVLRETVHITRPGERLTLVINQNASTTGGWGWQQALKKAGAEEVSGAGNGVNRFTGLRIITGRRARWVPAPRSRPLGLQQRCHRGLKPLAGGLGGRLGGENPKGRNA